MISIIHRMENITRISECSLKSAFTFLSEIIPEELKENMKKK